MTRNLRECILCALLGIVVGRLAVACWAVATAGRTR